MVKAIPLNYPMDTQALLEVLRPLGDAVMLDSSQPKTEMRFGRFDILSAAPEILVRTDIQGVSIRRDGLWSSVATDPFDYLESLINQLDAQCEQTELPFKGGLIGFWSYDLGRSLETLPEHASTDIDLPWMQLGLYLWAFVIDHQNRSAWLVHQPKVSNRVMQRLAKIANNLGHEANTELFDFTLEHQWQANQSKQAYRQALEKIDHYIRAGDCYQINYAQRFKSQYTGDPYGAYQRLKSVAPTPFAAFIETDHGTLLSLSPERFLQVSATGAVETRPIKGTRPRGSTLEDDQQQIEELREASKDRAENLMIVDLLRNDLSRACKPGSVKVPELFAIETYPNVHHLVSAVTGQLAQGQSALSLLKQCFPGGSITGAPKIRAMEIIDELEPDRRSIYCGAIGYISADGRMDTNISIRTLLCQKGTIYCWAGGGIVADSDIDDEYQETLNKVNNLLSALS